MTIDLSQFHQVFFEESLESLDLMEQGLLDIQADEKPDSEVINSIFRAAHSIKGGAGTFGFTDITDFTHVLETLLDEVREGSRTLSAEAIELLFQSGDCLRAMIVALQADEAIDNAASLPLIAAFEAILNGSNPAAETEQSAPAKESGDSTAEKIEDAESTSADSLADGEGGDSSDSGDGPRQWRIDFHPHPEILLTGNEPLRLFRELAAMGELRTVADCSRIPPFDQLHADECFIYWTLWLTTTVEREKIIEVFDWVIDECHLEVTAVEGEKQECEPEEDLSPVEDVSAETIQPDTVSVAAQSKDDGAGEADKSTAANASSSSIRVGIDKVDGLINLVGELVITQSMLSELGNNFDMARLGRLSIGLDQLLQNTKELQESVMRIRMLPISFAFNRFPRMIRDLSNKTGKSVELKLTGEQTELDKTVMEQIGDPLVHLVRNAIDHGIESVEQRLASGKPEQGTIHLDASHQGGNIVIEISDDGKGIDPSVILAKAIEKGLVEKDMDLSESQIYDLVFEPGFSTAEVVSDISGRGVGMDVVRRNIKSLGGRIEIQSKLGVGSTFKIFLPLTLAIVDGQLVRVGTETYIVPLISIVESLQIKAERVNSVSGDVALYRLRDDNVPIIPIYQEFGIEADNTEFDNGLLVVVEGEGQKIGLLVDDLLAQQQVVIKSLESNYKRVNGISGATILGDGSVAMILDVAGLIREASERARKKLRLNRRTQAA